MFFFNLINSYHFLQFNHTLSEAQNRRNSDREQATFCGVKLPWTKKKQLPKAATERNLPVTDPRNAEFWNNGDYHSRPNQNEHTSVPLTVTNFSP
jgi:hypothetical protein